MRSKPLFLALMLALVPAVQAANLSDVYRDAAAHDAQYAAARAAYEAGQEKAVQGRAGLLPNVGLSGNALYQNIDTAFDERRFSASTIGVKAAQPLYRRQNQLAYQQSREQVKIAETQFRIAEQDLVLRVAQAYFDMLQSQDNLEFIAAQKAAITEQLAAARRNFEVGTATITDTHEAQARYDLALAEEIAEQNTYAIRLRALEKLIGKPAEPLETLSGDEPVQPPQGDIGNWAARAAEGNLQAEIQRILKTIADQEVTRNRAAHYPTLDAVAGYSVYNNASFATQTFDMKIASVGVELNMPLYQGGLITSQVREAVANQERAHQELENATRDASLQARHAWLNVSSGAARVQALEQALTSTEAQLASTKLGLEVGVRTSLDVLDAEQQVWSARRNLAGARYAYLLAGLSLKAAVGALGLRDLVEIDRHLQPPARAAAGPQAPLEPPAPPQPASMRPQ